MLDSYVYALDLDEWSRIFQVVLHSEPISPL